MRIPKKLHLALIGSKPDDAKRIEIDKKNRNILKDYEFHNWDSENCSELFNQSNDDLKKFFDTAIKLENWNAANNLIKTLALLKNGGWAIDLGQEFVSPPKPFERIPFVSGYQKKGGQLVSITSVWGAFPQQKFLRIMLSAYGKNPHEKILEMPSLAWINQVILSAGSRNNNSRQYLENIDVHLFPDYVFSNSEKAKNTYVINHENGE